MKVKLIILLVISLFVLFLGYLLAYECSRAAADINGFIASYEMGSPKREEISNYCRLQIIGIKRSFCLPLMGLGFMGIIVSVVSFARLTDGKVNVQAKS